MLSDTDSLSIEIIGMILLIVIHGLATALNTAFGTENNITEKHQATNRLLIVLTAILGAWLVFPHWELCLAYLVLLVIFVYSLATVKVSRFDTLIIAGSS